MTLVYKQHAHVLKEQKNQPSYNIGYRRVLRVFLKTGSVGDDLKEDGSAFQGFGAAENNHLSAAD